MAKKKKEEAIIEPAVSAEKVHPLKKIRTDVEFSKAKIELSEYFQHLGDNSVTKRKLISAIAGIGRALDDIQTAMNIEGVGE